MSTWDIVDVFETTDDIVSTKPKPSAFRALITSATQVAFVITLAIGSATHVTIQRSEQASTLGTHVKFADSSQFVSTPAPPRRRVVTESDTQFGQSTVKLAQLFETYFVPIEDEDSFEDDYSFS